MSDGAPPLLYAELARWWHVMSDPADYEEEAEIFSTALEEMARREIGTVLEMGCGGGNNACHLKHRYRMTLSDLSAGMLEASRRLNPDCEHVPGDMRTLGLSREFDAVFVHDAIGYMTTEEDLLAAMKTARRHVRPGGVALFVPDHTVEIFEERAGFGGHDRDGLSFRYLDWEYDPDPDDGKYRMDFLYLLREGEGPVRVLEDRHEMGLFPRDTWLRLIGEAGLTPLARPYDGSTFEPPATGELFLGVRE